MAVDTEQTRACGVDLLTQSGDVHETPYLDIFGCVMLDSISGLRGRHGQSEQVYHPGPGRSDDRSQRVGSAKVDVTGTATATVIAFAIVTKIDLGPVCARDRGCRTVTVQERGETRTTHRCD